MKKIKEKGKYCTIYDDGSIDITCRDCEKVDELSPDNKNVARIMQIESAKSSYTCLDCWKKERDTNKTVIDDKRSDKIAYAQSWNLAVAAMNIPVESQFEDLEEGIEVWQKYFYEKLTERSQKSK